MKWFGAVSILCSVSVPGPLEDISCGSLAFMEGLEVGGYRCTGGVGGCRAKPGISNLCMQMLSQGRG